MKWIETIKLYVSLLPILVGAIQTVESVLPQAGAGAAKLDMLKSMLGAAYQSGDAALGAFDQVWPQIQGLVGTIVAAFNVTGVFKKS